MRARPHSRPNRRVERGAPIDGGIVSAPVLRIRDALPAEPHQGVHFSRCGWVGI